MKRTFLIKTFLFVILPFVGFSQQDGILNLTVNQAMEHAVQYNIDVRNARIDVEIADKKVWETTAIGLPQIGATGSYNNNLSLATQLIPAEFFGGEEGTFSEIQFGTKHNFNGSLTATQLIFSGSYLVGLQAAKIYRSLSEKSLTKTETDTKANVASTYYSILLTEESLEILKQNHMYLNDMYIETKKVAMVGMVEETEADKLKIQASSIKNAVNSTERQIEFLYLLFKIQIGADKETEIKLTDNISDILLEINIDEYLEKEFFLEEHVDYQLIKTQEDLMALDMKRYKSEYLPSLSAFYSFQENAMRNDFNPFDGSEKWFESSMLGVQIDVPIFNSGLKRSKVQQARLELEKVTNSKNFLESTLYSVLLQNRNNFITRQEILLNSKENMQTSKKVLDNISIKHKEGVAKSLELTQANQDYLSTVSQYTNAVVDLLNTKIELEKILNEL
jgi:outer membrane protein